MQKSYKGIILAGGSGSRLYPINLGTSKQLLPIYDKPMIYYSISVLMLSGIREILVISTKKDLPFYEYLLGDGSRFGINLQYEIQEIPDGLAKALIIGEKFIGDSNIALILGDNIFYGPSFSDILSKAKVNDGATIFAYYVNDPENFGVISFKEDGTLDSIEEKPQMPKSNFAVTGLYFYDNKAIEFAKRITPSHRGEYEITDLNNFYLNEGNLNVEILSRGFAWLDTGTSDSLLDAGQFIQTIEKRQGLKIACLEEISLRNGWIDLNKLEEESNNYGNSSYGRYLLQLIKSYESN